MVRSSHVTSIERHPTALVAVGSERSGSTVAQVGQPKKLTRRERLELIREMGAARFDRFMREAGRRLNESVRDCKDASPCSKAETTRTAVEAFVKLESLGAQYLNEELATAKLAEMVMRSVDGDYAAPRVIIQEAPIDDDPQAEQATDEGAPKPKT